MGENELHIGAYNFNFKIDSTRTEFGNYIINLLKQQFSSFENVRGIAISLKEPSDRNGSESGKNIDLLSPQYSILLPANNYKLVENIQKVKQLKFRDEDLLFSFYKNASDYGKKVFVITNDNKEIYKNLEDKIEYCKVYDAHTLSEVVKRDLRRKPFNESTVSLNNCLVQIGCKSCAGCKIQTLTECFKNKDEICSENKTSFNSILCNIVSNKDNCINDEVYYYLTAEIVKIFEDLYVLKDIKEFTAIAFPYFFVNKFIGVIAIIFDKFDSDNLETYVNFLNSVKGVFFRGIIYSIAERFLESQKPRSDFKDLLSFFLNVTELTSSNFSEIIKSHADMEQNDLSDLIYMPLIRKRNKDKFKLTLPFYVKYIEQTQREYECVFELNLNVNDNHESNSKSALEVVSHVQWLWDFYRNRKIQ